MRKQEGRRGQLRKKKGGGGRRKGTGRRGTEMLFPSSLVGSSPGRTFSHLAVGPTHLHRIDQSNISRMNMRFTYLVDLITSQQKAQPGLEGVELTSPADCEKEVPWEGVGHGPKEVWRKEIQSKVSPVG